ncbi:MAG TPA: serine/threonine protein kinase, partial [Firmicutes bacterium]|nr:serine/threonine protein kinase [Bacillota bacterium]
IHRDIKPQNIMVGEFGETVVLDWGLAKVKGKSDETIEKLKNEIEELKEGSGFRTVAGKAIGTPSYMPPEQAEGKLEEIDERSDVYSLGAVLYEILTGKPPFEGTTAYEIIGKVVNEDPVEPKKREEKIPEEISAITLKALKKNRNRRYESAKELADDIKRFMTGSLVSAYEYNPVEKLKKWTEKNKLVITTAGIGLAALLLFAIFSYINIIKKEDKADRALAQVFYELGQRSENERKYEDAFYYYTHSYLTYPLVIPDKDPSVKKMLEMSNRLMPEKRNLFFPKFFIFPDEDAVMLMVPDYENDIYKHIKRVEISLKLSEISSDEKVIVICDTGNVIYIINEELEFKKELKSEINIENIILSGNGRYIGLKSRDRFKIYDLEYLTEVFSADDMRGFGHSIFSPDNRHFFYYNDKSESVGVNLKTGKIEFKFNNLILNSISDDSRYIVLNEFAKRKVFIYELSSGNKVFSANSLTGDYSKYEKVNPVNGNFYYIDMSGYLKIYNLNSKKSKMIEVRGFFPNLKYDTDTLLFSRRELVRYLEETTERFRIKDSIYPQNYRIAMYVEERQELFKE